MANIFKEEEGRIPYPGLADMVFGASEVQECIPFLGAGVSISARAEAASRQDAPPSLDPRVAPFLDSLNLSGKSRLFLEIATEMALLIRAVEQQGAAAAQPTRELFDRLVKEQYPPSGGDLVELFSQQTAYSSFDDLASRLASKLNKKLDGDSRAGMIELLRIMARMTGISSTPLSSISAYFEAVLTRDRLLKDLGRIFRNKTTTTPTHKLLARAAAWHLRPEGIGHYLIVTTNYDCLMEQALTERNPPLPFVALTMDKAQFQIHARFGNMPAEAIAALAGANPARFPSLFTLEKPFLEDAEPREKTSGVPERLVIVYKIHGCLGQEQSSKNDTIIISDNDYVLSISRMSSNEGVIPSCVSDIMRNKPFLFLGYSLNDWNVRGILKAVRLKRGEEDQDWGDYTVMRTVRDFEQVFFEQNNIRIVQTTLNKFAGELDARAPEGA